MPEQTRRFAIRALSRRLTLGVAALVLGCGRTEATTAPGSKNDGTPTPPAVDLALYPEASPGTAPLIIIAPHGGDQSPASIPDRTCTACTTVNDANTQDLARLIADAFERRTGKRPHLVINRLHRRKFDANREIVEATGGYAPLEPVWRAFHDAIDTARARVARSSGRGLVIDLHGHAHAVARLELGYLLADATLRLTDSVLTARGDMARSSIARLATDRLSAATPVALLRGASSLGALLAASGYPSVPSPSDLAPKVGEEYFDGGYNTDRHGSRLGGATDAVQIECNFGGVRDTPENRARFAEVLATALERMLRDQYGWRP